MFPTYERQNVKFKIYLKDHEFRSIETFSIVSISLTFPRRNFRILSLAGGLSHFISYRSIKYIFVSSMIIRTANKIYLRHNTEVPARFYAFTWVSRTHLRQNPAVCQRKKGKNVALIVSCDRAYIDCSIADAIVTNVITLCVNSIGESHSGYIKTSITVWR